MSLFKVRDWWRVQCGSGDEEFDQGSLCVAALGDSPGGKGYLSIHKFVFAAWNYKCGVHVVKAVSLKCSIED